jgi:hypothetical protein
VGTDFTAKNNHFDFLQADFAGMGVPVASGQETMVR